MNDEDSPKTIRAGACCALGRIAVPSDVRWQCPPIRLSNCPTCGVLAGMQCVGIGRNDEVHVDRVWKCLERHDTVKEVPLDEEGPKGPVADRLLRVLRDELRHYVDDFGRPTSSIETETLVTSSEEIAETHRVSAQLRQIADELEQSNGTLYAHIEAHSTTKHDDRQTLVIERRRR